VADEDAPGTAYGAVDEPRLLERRQHLAQAGPAGSVAFCQLAFAAELGAGRAGVDVGNDPAPQLLGWR
jgi:hypothetical protein